MAGTAVVVDEQIISGESTPIEKLPSNPEAVRQIEILLRACHSPSSSGTIARLSDAIRDIRLRGPRPRLADTLAGPTGGRRDCLVGMRRALA